MAKVEGRVTIGGSGPATDAVVEIHNARGDVVDQVQVDSDGRYVYYLSEGTWALNVWNSNGRRGHCEVAVGSDDSIVDIELVSPPSSTNTPLHSGSYWSDR